MDDTAHEDKQLVVDAQADSQAFAQLYTKYVDKIFQFIYYRVGQDREQAMDLTAEVFTRGLQNIHRFEWQGYPYSAYLYRIARSICQEHYKKPAPDSIEEIVISDEKTESPIQNADVRLVWEQINQLPDDIREIFELRYIEDLSFEQIAEVVGKKPGAIRTALSRATKKLQLWHEAYETN